MTSNSHSTDKEMAAIRKENEVAIIAAILADNSRMVEIAEVLDSSKYFTDRQNGFIYSVLLDLYNSKGEKDFCGSPLMLSGIIAARDKRKIFGVDSESVSKYINEIVDAISTDATRYNVKEYKKYANIIKWDWQKDQIAMSAKELANQAVRVNLDDREDFIGRIEDGVGALSMSVHDKNGLERISDMTKGIENELLMLHRGEMLPPGTMTGIKPLDQTLNGLKGGEVCVLCGRPALGKTALSMQIAYNVATTKPKDSNDPQNAVAIFSLEMMEDQLISRLISTISRVNMNTFVDHYQKLLSEEYQNKYGKKFADKMKSMLNAQYDRIEVALKAIKELPIYPTTESGLSANSIKSMLMQKQRELECNHQKLALVVIDYLQLMIPTTNKKNASRTEEVGEMSRKVKLIAKEFDVPILLLAQLNRNADPYKKPEMKDLRESGSIEQDADKIITLYCENLDPNKLDVSIYQDPQSQREALKKERMKIKLSVLKNRQGGMEDIDLIFDRDFQAFIAPESVDEDFDGFFETYYQKSRNDDLFYPLSDAQIPAEYVSIRRPLFRESNYLTNDGRVLTLSNSDIAPAKNRPLKVESYHKPPFEETSAKHLDYDLNDSYEIGKDDRLKPNNSHVNEIMNEGNAPLIDDENDSLSVINEMLL